MRYPSATPVGDMVVAADGRLFANGRRYRCALGSGGISTHKSEGDGVTPAGRLPLRYGLYRADRLEKPVTRGLPMYPIPPAAGWCDDPVHQAYNQAIHFPFDASAERLWRMDSLYDLVIVLGFNDAPVTPNLGSAIFLHVARAAYPPTEGCIALAKKDLLTVLKSATQKSCVVIVP